MYKVYEPKLTENYYTETDYPIEATEWIKNNLDLNDIRLYNNYAIGSYLLFNGMDTNRYKKSKRNKCEKIR